MRSTVIVEKVADWGQPPANNYILFLNSGIYIGGLTSSSSIQDNTLDSTAHTADIMAVPDPPPVTYVSRQEIDALVEELLLEDAELYRRLAQ